ncbi:MAG: hypothetical protein AABZ74_06630, partial [Cyanobacteriota bacterium]
FRTRDRELDKLFEKIVVLSGGVSAAGSRLLLVKKVLILKYLIRFYHLMHLLLEFNKQIKYHLLLLLFLKKK